MNQQAKTKRSFPYVALILWVTVALVVLILGYTLMDTVGILGRMNSAATTNDPDFKLNENQMDVYRYHVAQNQLYMQYMYVQYGMMSDPTGGLIQYMDAATYINYMLPTTVGSGDFDELAYDYAEQYLTYCLGAKDANLYDSYASEVEADIDEYIEDLKTSAKTNGITFGSYLKNFFGAGVSEKDIRSAMKYYYVGGKYAEKLADDFAAAVTDEEEKTYRDEHKESFYTTSYTSYKLVSNDLKADFEKCTSIDGAKTIIVDYYLKQKFEAQYKTNFTDKKVEDAAGQEKTKEDIRTTLLSMAGIEEYKDKAVFKDTDTDAYKKAGYAIVKAINTSITAQTGKLVDTEGEVIETSAAWVDIAPKKEDGTADTDAAAKLTDLQKWLFGEGRKTGDVKVIESKSTSKDKDGKETTTTTYTWYIVGKDVMVLDEELTKNAHYILLTDDGKDVENGKTGKEKAEGFHKELAAANTAENFEALVEKYAPGYTAELVENISYKTMAETYEELADWLYDKDRKEGDVSSVITVKNDSKDKEKITGYLVALYMGENEETWKVQATNAIAGEKLTEWYDKKVKEHNVVVDYEFATETVAETK